MTLERCPGCATLFRPRPGGWEGLCRRCDGAADLDDLALEAEMYHDLPDRLAERTTSAAAEIRRLRARVAELEGAETLTYWPVTEPAPIPIPGEAGGGPAGPEGPRACDCCRAARALMTLPDPRGPGNTPPAAWCYRCYAWADRGGGGGGTAGTGDAGGE